MSLSDHIIAVEGTEFGRRLAMWLALAAAFLHALFGALQKGRHDPWLSRGVIDASYGLMALPVALFAVPWPAGGEWVILAVAFVIHTAYKVLQALAYERGAYTVVYPVVRGTGPLFAVLIASAWFAERFSAVQWLGVGVLLSGIYGLAAVNLGASGIARGRLGRALGLAVATGLFVAFYTTWDAFGIRTTPDPFTFLAWFFLIDAVAMPSIAAVRWRRMPQRPAPGPLALRGITGALVAFASFGAIMLATRLDKVGEAAVLRETSTVFAALIGWLVLGERVDGRRLLLMATIAAGAVLVELGGA